MKECPILFSGTMVKAILDGRKSQTRRVAKVLADSVEAYDGYPGEWSPWKDGERHHSIACPYGVPGDRLWVKEQHEFIISGPHDVLHVLYRADMTERDMFDAPYTPKINRGRPSIHMPRWASRLTLEITDVRVQRLQEISIEDATAEGIEPRYEDGRKIVWPDRIFPALWDSINAKRAPWNSNPFVWAITFRRVTP